MLAESHLTRRLFGCMVRRIEVLAVATGEKHPLGCAFQKQKRLATIRMKTDVYLSSPYCSTAFSSRPCCE